MKRLMRLLITLFLATIICNTSYLFSEEKSSYTYSKQPAVIQSLLNREKEVIHAKNIISILNYIDSVYGQCYENLKNGKKLTIFFDPAHGKLPNGRWQGNVTGRSSCTNLPEEYYSIPISRAFYNILKKNPFIEIKSTPDFMDVLEGKSEVYKNIPFSTTVALAKREKAFLLIAEHLNNVATIHKAGGISNIPGIHVTQNRWGGRYLSYIKNIYEGYLTLYNKLDTTGLSRAYALDLKKKLVARGTKFQNWEYGSVGDDRFTFFVDFPVSVIFESGFISNPEEEKKLRDPDYHQTIARAQYQSLLQSLRDVWGIDISGNTPRKLKDFSPEKLTMLKLSRLAIYYIKSDEAYKGIEVINEMIRRYKKTHQYYLKPYREVKKLLSSAQKYFDRGKKLLSKKIPDKNNKYRKKKKRKSERKARRLARKQQQEGKRLIRRARRIIKRKPLFYSLRELYAKEYKTLTGYKKQKKKHVEKKKPGKSGPVSRPVIIVRKASITKPIILAIEENQGLKNAIVKALAPGPKELARLLKAFNNAHTTKKVRRRKYSKKRKRKITYWKKIKRKIRFRTGIYIVQLSRKLKIRKAKRVNKVRLTAHKYQNHQYLKNSYFAHTEKKKSL